MSAADGRKHTLERLADGLGTKFNPDKLHTAMLLSFGEAAFGAMRRVVTPSPLYRITYDEENNKVSLDENNGLSLPHKDGSLDITVEEEIFCCNIRDIPLLLVGETGVGKTFAATKYLSTIFTKEQFFSYRLSANAFVNNLFTHFQEGKMQNGMPVITAKLDKIATTAGGILDEINRGDSNETLQMLDNEMHLGGVIYKLGIPIPEFKGDGKAYKFMPTSSHLKKMLLVCASNPSSGEDAKFTQTMQLDAAVDNRLLRSEVGNAAPSAGSTIWLGDGCPNLHNTFMETFKQRVVKHTGVDAATLDNLTEDWLSVYSWITEAGKTDKPILYSAMELSDLMIATFSMDPREYYDYERLVIQEWDAILNKGVEVSEGLQETERVKQLNNVIGTFRVPIIFRDIVQIKKIADVLATLKNVTDALRSKNPTETYNKTKRYVTVREVAGAITLMARNKQSKDAESPLGAINEVLTQYVNLVEDYMHTTDALNTSFSLLDPMQGIKNVAIYKSLKDTLNEGGGIDYLIHKIAEQAEVLTKKITVSEDIRNLLIVRSAGDLMTLCGFLNQYRDELNPLLSGHTKDAKIPTVIEELGKFYYSKLNETALTMPEIYQHRIQRTLGI